MPGPTFTAIKRRLTSWTGDDNRRNGTIVPYAGDMKHILSRYATDAMVFSADEEIRNFQQGRSCRSLAYPHLKLPILPFVKISDYILHHSPLLLLSFVPFEDPAGINWLSMVMLYHLDQSNCPSSKKAQTKVRRSNRRFLTFIFEQKI